MNTESKNYVYLLLKGNKFDNFKESIFQFVTDQLKRGILGKDEGFTYYYKRDWPSRYKK